MNALPPAPSARFAGFLNRRTWPAHEYEPPYRVLPTSDRVGRWMIRRFDHAARRLA
ncbi:hypothetical protein GCM10023185_38170 [Hymenobacter saemangeumensis]|uniref:Uncharacterized protein n=1 Tax=Hymenobacter saemangeumensis TaxID=1084522 RepID=A0ABP8IRI8_9BACT